MSGTYSPYTRSGYSDENQYYNSPSPTPSPRPSPYMMPPQQQPNFPQRPATRAHFRTPSQHYSTETSSSRPPTASPRYTSDGHYATKTANVSARHFSPAQSPSTPPAGAKHARRSSCSEPRSPAGVGIGRIVEVDGVYYLFGADAKSKRRSGSSLGSHPSMRQATDFFESMQGGVPGYGYREAFDDVRQPRPQPKQRRSSVSTPQRPSTARPTSSHRAKPPPAARAATETDRLRHKIPQGYSIKNWDPSETPILLLGSVFDANSLGKWIYDWTIYHHGPATRTSDVAGSLWLLLIEFAGKVKSAEDVVNRIRSSKNKDIVEDFIAAGERLSDKLTEILKRCEEPMLRAAKRKDASLGKNAGVEFVETLFGPESGMERTQKFIKQLETFNKRFSVNCDEIIKRPTM